MDLGRILIGAIVLLFGRKLFWLLIALMGFLLGYELATVVFDDMATWAAVLLGVGVGALGALVAIIFQRMAFALAGFYAGGFMAMRLAAEFQQAEHATVYFVIGGILGAIIAAVLMDRAIILLSSIVGAGAIVQGAHLEPAISLLVFIVLVIVGLVIQSRQLRPKHIE